MASPTTNERAGQAPRRAARWLATLLVGGLAAGGACGGGGGGTGAGSSTGSTLPLSCLTGMTCVTDADCKMGSHCNTGLTPPACETLYCGPLGTACTEPANCATGLDCADLVGSMGEQTTDSRCCLPEGNDCAADADCCSVAIDLNRVRATCQGGACTRTCMQPGGECSSDGECCAGNTCDTSMFKCVGMGTGSCATCKDTFAKGDYFSVTLCLGSDHVYANLHGCECQGPCASSCAADCQDPMTHTAPCTTCLMSQCSQEYADCQAN